MATPNLTKSGLTVTPTLLASAQLANGANTVYTVPADKAVKIASMVLTNVTASAVVVTVSVLPAGGAVDGTHEVIHAYSLAGSDTLVVDQVKGWLGDGASIRVNAGAGASVNALVTGLVFA